MCATIALLAAACGAGARSEDSPPIYQSAAEIVELLDDSSFACPDVVVHSADDVLDVASGVPGLVGVAECAEGLSSHPDLSGYAVLVFDSEENRRLGVIGVLAFGCMQVFGFPYGYGPNWLIIPWNDRTPFEPVEEAARVASGAATAADCAAFYDSPEGTHDEMDPADLDLDWYTSVTGEATA